MNVTIRNTYHQELAGLEDRAIEGLDLVVRALGRTLEALENRDLDLAQNVVADDFEIDARYLLVHQGLMTLLATQSPVATDLRLISALLHVIKAVERMGDQCANICKMMPLSGSNPPSDLKVMGLISRMGHQAHYQVLQAKRAFVERDEPLAQDLVSQDNLLDRLNRECFWIVAEIGDEPELREWAMAMLLAARALERIGDHTVDVGEQVVFVVSGLFREFHDSPRLI